MTFFVVRPLRDARTLITGASSGIGRAIAAEFARRGAKLLLNARRGDVLHALAKALRTEHRADVEVVVGDVTAEAVRGALIDRARDRFGGLDVLVNNAGVGAFGRFDEAAPDRLRRIFELNFFATVELTRAALPLLRAGRKPAIVNIGSILGHRGIPLASEYCAAKFAVRGFGESLRAELHRQGVSVLLVSPGTTDTGFFQNVLEMRSALPWRKSGRRGVAPDYVARRTAYALEHDCAEIVPGLAGKLLVTASRLFPRLLDVFMRRQLRPVRGEN